MADVHSAHAAMPRNPYVKILNSEFQINADGLEVKRMKPKDFRPGVIRYLEKILVSEIRFFEGTPCWEWQGCKTKAGYGQFKPDARRGGKLSSPHRFAHEYFIGSIPEGFEVDHRCKNRGCSSPFHIEAVTLRTNRKRRTEDQTHCKHGHEFNEENTKMVGEGRKCMACDSIRILIYYAHSDSPKINANDRAAAQKRLEKAVAYGEIPVSLLGDHLNAYQALL